MGRKTSIENSAVEMGNINFKGSEGLWMSYNKDGQYIDVITHALRPFSRCLSMPPV